MEKKNNIYLLQKQLETLRIFFEKGVISKDTYEYEIKVLTEKIDVSGERNG